MAPRLRSAHRWGSFRASRSTQERRRWLPARREDHRGLDGLAPAWLSISSGWTLRQMASSVSIGEAFRARDDRGHAHALGRYAALVPGSRPVPVIEPGSAHGWCSYPANVRRGPQRKCCRCLYSNALTAGEAGGLSLKPNMVLQGRHCPKQETVDEVAGRYGECFAADRSCCRSRVAFLSGGTNWRNLPRPF